MLTRVPPLAAGPQPAIPHPAVEAAPPPPRIPTPAVFEDLPRELVCEVGRHVFEASVVDSRHSVASLDCNQAMRDTLSAELQAGTVLRAIHTAGDWPALLAALDDVGQVFPAYRHGCLAAVIHMLARMPEGPNPPAAFWPHLAALLPTLGVAPGQAPDTGDPREALLVALVRALRSAKFVGSPAQQLGHLMMVIGPDRELGPALARMLVAWTADVLDHQHLQPAQVEELRRGLLASAPAGLHARLQGIFEFTVCRSSRPSSTPVHDMAAEMQLLESAQPACGADLSAWLKTAASRWKLIARISSPCRKLLIAFFERLPPRAQLQLVLNGVAPLTPDQVLSFLRERHGQVPVAALLAVLDEHQFHSFEMGPGCGRFVRETLQPLEGSPQWPELLLRAISFHSIGYFELRPQMAQWIGSIGGDDRIALELSMDLTAVGNGAFERYLEPSRRPLSQRIDALLADETLANPRAVETLVESNVCWLTQRQQCQLIQRVGQLPPDRGAPALTAMIRQASRELRGGRQAPDCTVSVAALEVCARLPPEYRAQPLAAMFEALLLAVTPAQWALGRLAADLYEALPPRLRPPLDHVQRAALKAVSQRSVRP